jgi:hypothetical protein
LHEACKGVNLAGTNSAAAHNISPKIPSRIIEISLRERIHISSYPPNPVPPLSVYYSTDASKTGIGKDRPVLAAGANPYLKGSCGTGTVRSCVHWLNPASFSAPAAGTFGNVSKGEFTGPGFWDWDMGVFKNIPITERYSAQFRGELFDAFNHTNFMNDNTGAYFKSPVQTYTGAGFGNILAANDPRIIQLAL